MPAVCSPGSYVALTCPPKTGPDGMLVCWTKERGLYGSQEHTPEQIINKLREAEVAISRATRSPRLVERSPSRSKRSIAGALHYAIAFFPMPKHERSLLYGNVRTSITKGTDS